MGLLIATPAFAFNTTPSYFMEDREVVRVFEKKKSEEDLALKGVKRLEDKLKNIDLPLGLKLKVERDGMAKLVYTIW